MSDRVIGVSLIRNMWGVIEELRLVGCVAIFYFEEEGEELQIGYYRDEAILLFDVNLDTLRSEEHDE